jgi:hypothetical protein
MIKKISGILIALVLIAGLAYQSAGAAQYLSGRFQNKLLANRNLDAFARSADASYGGDFAAYISFLRTSIPAGATVLIPPQPASGYPVNDLYLMQYFLFPRRIETCPSDCGMRIAEPGIYILTQQDFPPADLVPASRRLVLFAAPLGVLIPGK